MKNKLPAFLLQKNSQSSSIKKQDIQKDEIKQQKQFMSKQFQSKIQKMFIDSCTRQDRYLQLISEQQRLINTKAEQYLQSLNKIKLDFYEILKKNGEKQTDKWITYSKTKISQQKIKLNPNEFTTKTKSNIESQIQKYEPRLKCWLNPYYLKLQINDYLRQQAPQLLIFRFRSVYPTKQISKQFKILKGDEFEYINSILKKYPLQIVTLDDNNIYIQFTIPCQHQAIQYYKNKQFQIQIINKKGQFVYAYAKLNLSSLLFYDNQQVWWNMKAIPFYCPITGNKICQVIMKFSNQIQHINVTSHYKIQSQQPISIQKFKAAINYNDQQSRIIHRISKFKTSNNSLLLGINKTNLPNAERYFQQQNEKLVILHKKKKQLQKIKQIKQSQKQEMLDKFFNEAIQQFCLVQCQISRPKYIIYNYHNNTKNHCKIFIKPKIKLRSNSKQLSPSQLKLQQSIQAYLLSPQQINILIKKRLIDTPKQLSYDYLYNAGQSSIISLSGVQHGIVIKVFCQILPLNIMNQKNLQNLIDLQVSILDQFDQNMQNFLSKLKFKLPIAQHRFYLHGYHQSESLLSIPLDEQTDEIISKAINSNIFGLQYQWGDKWLYLELKIKHQKISDQQFYIAIYDSSYLQQIACYQITLSTYPRLNQKIKLKLGEVVKLDLQFIIQSSSKNINSSKSISNNNNTNQVLVGFFSSKPQHCSVKCQNQPQLLCKKDKIYNLNIMLQTYNMEINPQKIIIHALDLKNNLILKKWLIQIQKQAQDFQKTIRLKCKTNSEFKYKFDLINLDKKQKNYRCYTNNLSILKVPQHLILLKTNQKTTIDLQFHIKKQYSQEQLQKPIKIILTTTNGSFFWNYLFQLNINQ